MRTRMIPVIAVVLLGVAQCAGAAENPGMKGARASMAKRMTAQVPSGMEVGNTVCPVSGEKVGGKMGPPVKMEYKGKVYNLCCPGCVATFKQDPEKYAAIAQAQAAQVKNDPMAGMAEQTSGHQAMMGEKGPSMGDHQQMMGEGQMMGEQNMPMGEHHHMMGENDTHMMAASQGQGSMMQPGEKGMMGQSMTGEKGQEKKEFNVEAFRYGYSPDTITVNKGDTVVIHATSRDVPHGFAIKEYGINARLEKGKTTDIKFVADKPGEFVIYCTVYCGPGHRNMKGKLIVK